MNLNEHLSEQIEFLKRSAYLFDQGHTSEAKRVATTLRVLLHDTQHSHSLLAQLNMKSMDFFDSAKSYLPDDLMPYTPLVGIHSHSGGSRFVPLLGQVEATQKKSFDEWWGSTVLRDSEGTCLTRQRLILAAANKDGGAHIDLKLPKNYEDISRRNSIGWMSEIGGLETPLTGAEFATIRQICHEVLKSLDDTYTCELQIDDGMVISNVSVRPVRDDAVMAPHRPPEVSDGKMRFFPESGEAFFQGKLIAALSPDTEYVFRTKIDSVTVGSIRAVVGGNASEPINSPGEHERVVLAGQRPEFGILGDHTDAVLDWVSLSPNG